ncbi:TonB-dependent receptor [Granulicella paludicola]|uniref:TonB-dependent receptor n=1 Tax=Granulicella paludicola TaxID=474951 RepID=UPI0021DFC5AC|nr:TonB-dependent receptor [Granulicella paludicola]
MNLVPRAWKAAVLLFTTAAALTALTPRATAQKYLGSIQGEISDPSGAKIPGVHVTAEDVTTHFKTTVSSSADGAFVLQNLNPSTYTVTATAPTFKVESRMGIVLTAGELQVVNITLNAGGGTESVEVSADSNVLIDTGSANIATTLGQQEVTDLPNVGRNPFVMATLAAGISTNEYFQVKASQYTNPYSGVAVQISSLGNGGHNRLTLNGIPDDPAERFSGASYTGFVPSPEAVQEVKVQTSIFDAQVGHGNGTVTNTVVRGGTNQLHGAAYYIFQNTYLDANNYERVPNQNGALNPTAPTHRNNNQVAQTGFVVDGPVWIPKLYNGQNKSFFMLSYEFYQTHTALNFSSRVPTAAERMGDFSGLCSVFNPQGLCTNGIQIYDPNSPVVGNVRTAYFANNQIPTARINATGAALMNYYPQPNIAGAGATAITNYTSNQTSYRSSYPSIIGRFDQAIGSRNKLNITLFRSGLTQSYPFQGYTNGIPPYLSASASGASLGGYGYSVYRNNRGGSLDDVHQFSSTMVLDSRLGVIWHPFGLTYPGNSNFNLGGLGINTVNMPYLSFPGITTTTDNYSGLAPGASGQVSTNLTGSLEETLTKTWGRHSVRFGFEGNLIHYNVQNPQSGFTGYTLNRTSTQQNYINSDANSGDDMAGLLLGTFNTVGYNITPAYALKQIYIAPFAQDDWRVTDKLTVNLGVRWDYESPFSERYNKQVAGFCLTCASPLQSSVPSLTLNGGLLYTSSSNPYPYKKDLNNWQPRVGFSYQVTPTTVVRGGYGIIYFNTLESPTSAGFNQTTTSNGTSTSSPLPQASASNPFPNGVLLPTGSNAGLATGIGTSVSFYDPNHVQPSSMQYTANLQQQFLGNLSVQIAYVGQRARQLEVSQNLDALPQQYYYTGTDGAGALANQTYLNSAVANPMAGKVPTNNTLNAATISRALLLVPYPEFSGVTELGSSLGRQRYDALQIQVSKPMKHHVSFQGNFTWDKLINQTTYLNNFGPGSTLARLTDPGASLNGNLFGTLELPRFEKLNYAERLVLGGWQVSTVLRAQNGGLISEPGNVYQIGNPVLAPHNWAREFNTCYENYAGQTVATSSSSAGCDNTSPATNPAYRQRYSYTYVTNPQYIDSRATLWPTMDANVFKKFIFHQSMSFEIRGDFFNVLNRPQFGGPGTSIGASNYGAVKVGTTLPTQANDARIGQLTARFNF